MTAHHLLNEGLRIGSRLRTRNGNLSNLYNNLGQTYYYLKNYDKSIVYFAGNYKRHLSNRGLNGKATLWFDVLNLQTPTPRRACSIRPENMLRLPLTWLTS